MLRLDQKGISLPLVLAILGIVVANTYYFMNLDQETKKQNIKRGAEIEDNTEKIRLISYLSDSTVCDQHFAGRTVPYTANTALAKNGVNFLETGPLYSRNSLQFFNYQIRETEPTAPLEKRYSLLVTYNIVDRSTTPPVATGKTKVIRLPLNLTFQGSPPSAGNPIKTCFTEPTSEIDTIKNVVNSSCFGDGVLLVNGNPPECQHNQPNISCTGGKLFTGLTSVPATGSLNFSCGKPINAGGSTGTELCSTTPIKTLLYEITIEDEYRCRSADNSCAQGDLLVMGAGGVHTCAKPCSSITLFNRMNSNGTSTCLAKPYVCPAGTYARTIYANGTADCQSYPILNKSCSAGRFATDIDPTKSNGDTALRCIVYNKVKGCAAPSDQTFVQSFSTVVPSCHLYNY